MYKKIFFNTSVLIILSCISVRHVQATVLERTHLAAPYDVATGTANTYQSYDDNYGGNNTVIGDINGDGLDDMIVGSDSANTANSGSETQGLVYVYLGNANASSVETNLVISGEDDPADVGFMFGSRIFLFDDISGDSLPDVAIGAPNYNATNKTFVGRVYIVTSQTLNSLMTDNNVVQSTSTPSSIIDLASVIFEGDSEDMLDAKIKKYETRTGNTYYIWLNTYGGDDSGSIHIFTPDTLSAIVEAGPDEIRTPESDDDAGIKDNSTYEGLWNDIFPWNDGGYLFITNPNGITGDGYVYVMEDNDIDAVVALGTHATYASSSYNKFILRGHYTGQLGTNITFVGNNGKDNWYVAISAPYYKNNRGAVYVLSQDYLDSYDNSVSGYFPIADDLPFVVYGEHEDDYLGWNLLATNSGTSSQVVVGERTVESVSSNDDYLFMLSPGFARTDDDGVEMNGKIYAFKDDSLASNSNCSISSESNIIDVATCATSTIVSSHNANAENGYHLGLGQMTELPQDLDDDGLNELLVGDGSSGASLGHGAVYTYNSNHFTAGESFEAEEYDDVIVNTNENDDFYGTKVKVGNFNSTATADYADVDVMVSSPRYITADDTLAWGALELVYDIEDDQGLRENYLAVGMTKGKYAVYAVEDDGTIADEVYTSSLDTKLPVQVVSGYFHSKLYYETAALPVVTNGAECHSLYFIRSDGEKMDDKTYKKLCHPNVTVTQVDISAGNVNSDDSGSLDEIVAVFPDGVKGAHVVVYKYSNSKWKIIAQKNILGGDYSNGATVSVGYLETSSREYIAVAPKKGGTVTILKMSDKKMQTITEKTFSNSNEMLLSIDDSNRILYVAQKRNNDSGAVKAYALNDKKLTAMSSKDFSVGTKAVAFSAMDAVIGVVNKVTSDTVGNYVNGVRAKKTTFDNTVVSLFGSKYYANNTTVVSSLK